MIGKQQSGKEGLASLHAARLETDGHLMEKARETAKEMLDPMDGYGLSPKDWPPAIIAALSRAKSLPRMEDPAIPITQTPT